MSNSHWKCEVNSPSQTIQLSSLWLAGGKHYKGVKRKQNCCAPILLFYKLLDMLLKKLKSHHKLINNLVWLIEQCLRESRKNDNITLFWKPYVFYRNWENELRYALLHVKWRKLIELYSSHKGNCFWVNNCFRQWSRQAERHKQAPSWRDTCTKS